MFWSGTRVIVHDFTYVNHNFYTLEDTFAGYDFLSVQSVSK